CPLSHENVADLCGHEDHRAEEPARARPEWWRLGEACALLQRPVPPAVAGRVEAVVVASAHAAGAPVRRQQPYASAVDGVDLRRAVARNALLLFPGTTRIDRMQDRGGTAGRAVPAQSKPAIQTVAEVDA